MHTVFYMNRIFLLKNYMFEYYEKYVIATNFLVLVIKHILFKKTKIFSYTRAIFNNQE